MIQQDEIKLSILGLQQLLHLGIVHRVIDNLCSSVNVLGHILNGIRVTREEVTHRVLPDETLQSLQVDLLLPGHVIASVVKAKSADQSDLKGVIEVGNENN